MRNLVTGAAFGLVALTAASCAFAPRDACTRDWFAYQADEIERDFVRRNRAPVRRMRDLQQELRSGFDDGVDVFAMLALASAQKDVKLLINDFRANVVPEAKSIAATCELDQGFDLIVDSFLARQGVDRQLVEMLELLGTFEPTPGITQALEPEAGTAPLRDPMPSAMDGALRDAPSPRDGVKARPGY